MLTFPKDGSMISKGFHVTKQVAMGDTVFHERVDRMENKGKPEGLPVVGVFKVTNGKISEWRDYCDSVGVEWRYGKNGAPPAGSERVKEGSLSELAKR